MKMFGKYELGRRLGKGGFSEVYLARYNAIDGFEKILVVKIMLPNVAGSPEFVDLFISEAKITAMLSHGNLVQVFDFGKVRDRYFMAMEYIKGMTIADVMTCHEQRGDRMPVEIALYVTQDTATDGRGRPLRAAHRDINPRNVFLQWDGSVKIADFGMVGILSVAEAFKGKAVGTMGYMSPEQAMGDPTDHLTDVYATGLQLYALVTGRPAFDISDEDECMMAQARAEFAPSRKLAPDVPDEVHGIIERATHRSKEERYQSAEEMAESISAVLYNMGRITTRTAAEYMNQFKEGPRAAPPPLPSDDEQPVSAEILAGSGEAAAAGDREVSSGASGRADAARPSRETTAPQQRAPGSAAPPRGPSFHFLVRGQKAPLGPLDADEVRECLRTGELTGFEKASTDGVRWMKWQYFTELQHLLGDPNRRPSARPMAGVLVVSSDPVERARYVQGLERKGFRAFEADSVEKAYDTCLLYRPEALLADVVTAGSGGFELLKVLRADPQTALIPVVLITALEARGVWSKGFRHGAADILPASLGLGEVADRVQAIIDGLPFRTAGESGKLTAGVAAELIRSIGRIRLSGVLHVTSGAMDGQVVFDQGEVIEARAGSLLKDEAIAAIANMRTGEYSFEEFAGATPTGTLVMPGVRADSRLPELAFRETRPLIWAEENPGQPFIFRPGEGLPDFLVQPVRFDARLPETAAHLRPCAVAVAALDTRAAEMKKQFRADRRISEIPLILVSPILLSDRDQGTERGLGMSPVSERIFANTLRKTLSPTWMLRKMVAKGVEHYSGKLGEIGPATLLESVSEQGFGGLVFFEGPFGSASIVLDKGAPVSAAAAGALRAQGREAFVSVMYWRAGRFILSAKAPAGIPNLASGMTGLLDEAYDEVNSRLAGAHIRTRADMPLRLARPIDDADLETLSNNVKLVVALADEHLQPQELIAMAGLDESESREILASLLALGVIL